MKVSTIRILSLGLAAALGSAPLLAQQADPNCAPLRDLVTIPTIEHKDGRLKGVVMLADEERWMAEDAEGTSCQKQHIRYLKGYSLRTPNPDPWPSAGGMLPGPTLRARVGDLVELAFINQVNLKNFPTSLDQGERGNTDGCDLAMATGPQLPAGTSRQIYPMNPNQTPGDSLPNCLHGSSTANIHYHGSHTTPSTTGDNVLLYVRPAPRDAEGNVSGPTEQQVLQQSAEVWEWCEGYGPVHGLATNAGIMANRPGETSQGVRRHGTL